MVGPSRSGRAPALRNTPAFGPSDPRSGLGASDGARTLGERPVGAQTRDPRAGARRMSPHALLSRFAAWVCPRAAVAGRSSVVYKSRLGRTSLRCGSDDANREGPPNPSPEAALSRKAFFLPLMMLCAAAWMAGCAQTPPPGMARGKELFTNCEPCHGKGGQGNPELDAPEIAGLPKWYI